MRTKKIIITLTCLTALAASCTRDNAIIVPEPPPVAGVGGKNTLRVYPQHHGVNINNAVVYIKYNATTEPAAYDDSITLSGPPPAVFANLKKGNYYLLARGTDPALNDTLVKGGAHFNVVDTFENTYDILLAVTEGGPH